MLFKQTVIIALTGLSALAGVMAEWETPYNLPDKTDAKNGQYGFNACRKRWGDSDPGALCQNLYINSLQDFCLFIPAKPNSVVSDVEAKVVSACMNDGYGTRRIPKGAITGAQFRKTPKFVQISLVGDFTKLNVADKDEGGELDAHGAYNTQNPVGAVVYSRSWDGKFERTHEWHEFLAYNEASVRACKNEGTREEQHDWCPNQYDEMGSQWNDAGRYDAGIFENCEAETGEKPGIYNNKRWHQGEKPEPEAHKPGKLLGCKRFNGFSRGKAKLIPGSRRRMNEEDFVERVEGIEWDVRDDKVHVPGDGWF